MHDKLLISHWLGGWFTTDTFWEERSTSNIIKKTISDVSLEDNLPIEDWVAYNFSRKQSN